MTLPAESGASSSKSPLCLADMSIIRWIASYYAFVCMFLPILVVVHMVERVGSGTEVPRFEPLAGGSEPTKHKRSHWMGIWRMNKCPGGKRRYLVSSRCKSMEVIEKHTFSILNHFWWENHFCNDIFWGPENFPHGHIWCLLIRLYF